MKALIPVAACALALGSFSGTALAAAPYTTADTTIGTLIEDDAAKAVIEKHFPGFTTADSIQMASGMTLRQIQQFKPDLFTDAELAKVDTDLAKLSAK